MTKAQVVVSRGALALLLTSCWGSKPDPLKGLGDTPLTTDFSKIPFQREQVLTNPGTYAYDLSQLVGHVLFLEKDSVGKCQPPTDKAFDATTLSWDSYLKPDTKLQSQTINNLLFDNKVSNGGAAELSVLGFGPAVSDTNVAQLTIVETAFLNYPDNTLAANWRDRVREETRLTGCPSLLIRGAVIRVATARFFHKFEPKVTADMTFSNAVFKANGKLYTEAEGTQSKTMVSLTSYLVRPGVQELQAVDSTHPAPEGLFPRLLRVPDSGAIRWIPKTAALQTPALQTLLRKRGIIIHPKQH